MRDEYRRQTHTLRLALLMAGHPDWVWEEGTLYVHENDLYDLGNLGTVDESNLAKVIGNNKYLVKRRFR